MGKIITSGRRDRGTLERTRRVQAIVGIEAVTKQIHLYPACEGGIHLYVTNFAGLYCTPKLEV